MVVYGPAHPAPLPTPPTGGAVPRGVGRDAASSAAPAGQPSLWNLLTDEERRFFAQQADLGPLTYGPRGGRVEQPEAPKGQRLDVRG